MSTAQPKLDDATQEFAKLISIVVRNAMEDFHCEHLSDEQMRALNPIIRNAVATALHAFNNYAISDAARRFLDFHGRCIPSYWETPELLAGYVKMWQRDKPGQES